MTTRLVLFDIDGTLLRTGGAGVKAFARVAELVFGRPGGTEHLRFHGRTDVSLVREFLREHSLPDTTPERTRFLDAYVFLLAEELRRHAGETCPGVNELLLALRHRAEPPILGLLTGNIRLGAALKLAAHGLAEEFILGAFGDDHQDRNELARIARQRGAVLFGHDLRGEEVVVVGDTRADIECARAIGARCVAVATGAESLADLLECSPALALESLAGVSADRILAAGEHLEQPADWEALYRAQDTRWDHGGAAPALLDFLAEIPAPAVSGGSVVVPGCGRGHDARAWADAGFTALGLDLAPTAIAEARSLAPAGTRAAFRVGDFLADAPDQRFDWVFEHTLFCAIPPGRREEYVRAVTRWLRPGGHYLAINYLQPQTEIGPPFAVTMAQLRQWFEPRFELVKHWRPRSFPVREGRERIFLWHHRT